MKSKSLPIGQLRADSGKQNRVFDFVQLYKDSGNASASSSGGLQPSDTHHPVVHKIKSESAKRERSQHKQRKSGKREPVDISQINLDGSVNNSVREPSLSIPKVTSTPIIDRQDGKAGKVIKKSIMKQSSFIANDSIAHMDLESSSSKPKKRNKSVSFMLEDKDEILNKKTKSDVSTDDPKSDSTIVKEFKVKRKFKKSKRDKMSEKENSADLNNQTVEDTTPIKEKSSKKLATNSGHSNSLNSDSNLVIDQSQVENASHIKKKHKKPKKNKAQETMETESDANIPENSQEVSEKAKKPKKKKHQDKPQFENNEEPVQKSRKKDSKPDVITELENLSIGDNPHTLTNLLDEMTVVDKDKRKKLKHKSKNKKSKSENKGTAEQKSTESKSTNEPTNEEGQEKVKWMRRKWNKEHKADKESVDNTVVVENVPLSLLLSYKKVLAEHYVKYGLVRSVGIAEMYPNRVSEPVFTTTVNFYSDGAAKEALSDEWTVEGRRILVKRSLPATETTVAVRSYAPLCVATVATALQRAGPVRDIRHAVKGKHSMSTFFVAFDGPESVENALRLSTDLKIGGKKVYVSKFEVRTKKDKKQRSNTEASDADHSDVHDL